jgi:hypothetical protein
MLAASPAPQQTNPLFHPHSLPSQRGITAYCLSEGCFSPLVFTGQPTGHRQLETGQGMRGQSSGGRLGQLMKYIFHCGGEAAAMKNIFFSIPSARGRAISIG